MVVYDKSSRAVSTAVCSLSSVREKAHVVPFSNNDKSHGYFLRIETNSTFVGCGIVLVYGL